MLRSLRGRLVRLAGAFRRQQWEQSLSSELESNIELHVEENIRSGMSPEEARRQARLRYGGVLAATDRCRDARSLWRLDPMIRDFLFGLRLIRKQPGFALVASLTLALGIGATASVFSLIEGVLWTQPPYADPQELVLIPPVNEESRNALVRGWPAAQWQQWQTEADSFETIAAYSWTFNFLVGEDSTESVQGMAVTPNYFAALAVEPAIGRAFSDSEAEPGAPPVIIIGYDLWQRAFGGDLEVLGKPFRISRQETPPTIVGVMPPGVRFLPSPDDAQEPNYDVNSAVDYWLPAAPNPERLKRPSWDVVGRLRPDRSAAEAQTELRLITKRQAAQDPDFAGAVPLLRPVIEELNRDGQRILLPLFGASALVLLIACGNVAALLLVRGLRRRQEYAVRGALGVERAALFRQSMAESLLLALSSGVVGALIAGGIVRAMQAVAGHAIPRLGTVELGWSVLGWAIGAATFAAVVANLVPALRAAAMDPMTALKSAGPKSSAGRGERGILRFVTIGQTALTLVLLVGAGLLIRTMMNIAEVRSGYQTARVLTMSVTTVQPGWLRFHQTALERLSEVPGVERAAFAWGVPLTDNSWPGVVEIEGQPAPARESDRISVPIRAVTPGYFELLGLQLTNGRDFRASDGSDEPPVAVINQSFVDRYFPAANPIGKKLWLRGRNQPPSEVIAVVEDARSDDLTQSAKPEIYASLWQFQAFSKHLLVRTASASPTAVAASVQGALRRLDPTVAIEHVQTLEAIRDSSLATRRFAMQLLIGFAAVAILLTAVGVYGVLSLGVAARWRELAIRTTVGAQRNDIRALVFGDGFRLIGWGVLAGLLASLGLSRVLEAFLFGVDPVDPLTSAAVVTLFVSVGAIACWAPSSRAVSVNPADALRGD